MELTFKLVMHSDLKILRKVGVYPKDDGCYDVLVTEKHLTYEEKEYEIRYMPEPVYKMWKVLSSLANVLQKEDMLKIIDSFNEYGEYQYEISAYESAMR